MTVSPQYNLCRQSLKKRISIHSRYLQPMPWSAKRWSSSGCRVLSMLVESFGAHSPTERLLSRTTKTGWSFHSLPSGTGSEHGEGSRETGQNICMTLRSVTSSYCQDLPTCVHPRAEELWGQFFSDPSQWWDHTTNKTNPRYPDFKHKETGMALWINGRNPSWVKAELASLIAGSVSRSLYSWNAMISRCVKSDLEQDALEMYDQMQAEGVKPNAFTFARVLTACANLLALEKGRRVHAHIIESGCDADFFVGSNLLKMYSNCGSIDDAERVFYTTTNHDVVSWTTMLAGYVQWKQGEKALHLFALMQKKGVKPDPVAFVLVLNACASVTALEEGRHLHAQIIQSGCQSDVFVGSSLVNMYAKCGIMEDAKREFYTMPTRNVVSWSVMLAGYVKCGDGQKAVELFSQMQDEGVTPDPVTFVAVLNACASVMALEEGRRAHAQVIRSGYESNVCVGNTLVDMYAKCGSIEDAQRVFHAMHVRDVVSWTAMLGGFAMHGLGNEALMFFQEMYQAGAEINNITFICLLSACSHGGLVQEGIQLFESMGPVYGISPSVEHFRCMVDLLGRAGHLSEASDLLRKEHKITEDSITLTALLGACRNHGYVDMGEWIAKHVLELEPHNTAAYALLSNVYPAAGQSCNSNEERIQVMMEV